MFRQLLDVTSVSHEAVSDSALPNSWGEALPVTFLFKDLAEGLLLDSNSKPPARMASLLTALRYHERISRQDGDARFIDELANSAAKLVLPVTAVVGVESCCSGLALSVVNELCRKYGARLEPDGLLAVVAYTDSYDPWTTEKLKSQAESILTLSGTAQDRGFIVNTILRGYLKPLFSSWKSARITTSGRPSHYGGDSSEPKGGMVGAVDRSPLWTTEQARATTSFQWATKNADEDIMHNDWPLFVPVVLALLDNPDTVVKARGLNILIDLLRICPGKILRDTGLSSVLEEVLFPILLFLPPLVPVDESLRVLRPAYGSLRQLVHAQFASEAFVTSKNDMLGRVLRDGVFLSLNHVSDQPLLTCLLFEQTTILVNDMGIDSVKYLKDLLGVLVPKLTTPFLVFDCRGTLSALRALGATVAQCWPRFGEIDHFKGVLRAVSLCWLEIESSAVTVCEAAQRSQLVEELKQIARLLLAVTADSAESKKIIAAIIAEEPRLKPLLLE